MVMTIRRRRKPPVAVVVSRRSEIVRLERKGGGERCESVRLSERGAVAEASACVRVCVEGACGAAVRRVTRMNVRLIERKTPVTMRRTLDTLNKTTDKRMDCIALDAIADARSPRRQRTKKFQKLDYLPHPSLLAMDRCRSASRLLGADMRSPAGGRLHHKMPAARATPANLRNYTC